MFRFLFGINYTKLLNYQAIISTIYIYQESKEFMGAKGTVLKRVRQSLKANARNKHYKSFMKSALKNALDSTKDNAEETCKSAISAVDRVEGKGIIHKNSANRLKSRVMRHLNSL